jgi:hypothetical protein
LPTVSLAPSASAFLGLTFLTALLATLSALALTVGVAAEAFLAVSLTAGLAATFFAAVAAVAFFAICLCFAAAFLAVPAAFFFAGAAFAGALEVDFLVMPAALVRGPGPLGVVAFFFSGDDGAVGLGASSLAFSWGWGGLVRLFRVRVGLC